MNRLPPLLAASLLAAAQPAAAGGPPTGEFLVKLEPGKVHEECLRIEAGEKRRWFWKADAPVDFNIHYHHGNDVTYPVKRAGMRGDGGTFTAKTAEDYCWMWTARKSAVRIEGQVQR